MGEKPWERDWTGKKPWERDWAQQPVAAMSMDGTIAQDPESFGDGTTVGLSVKDGGMAPGEAGPLYKDVGRQLAKGATLNAAPRIEAAVRTGAGLVGDYGGTLQDINDQNADFEEAHPAGSTALQLIGGVAVPGVAAGRAYTTARAGARAAGYGSKSARVIGSAAAGAPTGAVYGALSSEDLTDLPQTVDETVKGAVAGAVAGPVLHGLWAGTKYAGRGARGLVERATGTGSQRWATQKSADVFEGRDIAPAHGQNWERNVRRDETALDTARANSAVYDNTNNTFVPNALAAMDNALTTEAEFAARARSTSAQPYTNFAEQTIQGQSQRVANNVPNILTNGQGAAFRPFMNHIDDEATVNRDGFYNAMRAGQVGNAAAPGAAPTTGHIPTAGLPAIIGRVPAMRGVLENAVEAAIARGVPYVNRQQILNDPRHLPSYVVDLMYRATSSADDDLLRGMHDRLRAELNSTPEGQWYLRNKEVHSNAFRSQTAAQRGRDIWSTSGPAREESLREIQRMQLPAARADARTAAAGSMQHHLEADNGSFARPASIVDRPENVNTMRELFGRGAADRTEDYLRRERNLHEVADRMVNAAAGNKQRDPNILEKLLRFKTKFTFTPSVALQDAAANMAAGYTKRRTAELARQLLSLDPADFNRVRTELARRSQVINNGHPSDPILAALAAVGSGQAQ